MSNEKTSTERAADDARVCPTCGERVDADSDALPFCSARCKLADLGRWFSGDFRISRRLEQSDLDELE